MDTGTQNPVTDQNPPETAGTTRRYGEQTLAEPNPVLPAAEAPPAPPPPPAPEPVHPHKPHSHINWGSIIKGAAIVIGVAAVAAVVFFFVAGAAPPIIAALSHSPLIGPVMHTVASVASSVGSTLLSAAHFAMTFLSSLASTVWAGIGGGAAGHIAAGHAVTSAIAAGKVHAAVHAGLTASQIHTAGIGAAVIATGGAVALAAPPVAHHLAGIHLLDSTPGVSDGGASVLAPLSTKKDIPTPAIDNSPAQPAPAEPTTNATAPTDDAARQQGDQLQARDALTRSAQNSNAWVQKNRATVLANRSRAAEILASRAAQPAVQPRDPNFSKQLEADTAKLQAALADNPR